MFASVENQTCYGECQSLFEDTILTHGLSFPFTILRNVFLKGLWVPEEIFLVSETESKRDMSHESLVTPEKCAQLSTC